MALSQNSDNNNKNFTSFTMTSPLPSSYELSTTPTPTRTKCTTNILRQRQPSFSSPSIPPQSSSQLSQTQDTSSSQTETGHPHHSNLTRETLSLLEAHHVDLPATARDELVELLNRYELRTKGIVKGRDATRLALRKKEEWIRELEGLVGM